MLHLQSAVGIIAIIAFAWAISENRRAVPWRPVVVGLAVTFALALIMLVLVRNVVRAQRSEVRTGIERLLGAHAQVKGSMDGAGFVFVAGALWRAQCDLPLQDGETVRIEAYNGLTLHVRPLSDNVAK